MKIDVKEIYEYEPWGWSDYQPMLDAFGKVAIQVDDSDYQGDSRLLYDENGKIINNLKVINDSFNKSHTFINNSLF